MASHRRKCLRFLAALFLLAVCGFYLSGYFIDTKIYVKKLPLPFIVYGKDAKKTNTEGPTDKDPYDVIVLTYMRSGSTFIGKLLGARDDAFYWYEPLWFPHTWKYHSKGQMLCEYGKDGCQNIPSTSHQSLQYSLQFLLDIYKCDLKGHFDRFADYWLIGSTLAGATYRKCLKSVRNCIKCLNDTSNQAVPKTHCKKCNECYDQWTNPCNNATHRVTKVLRLDTSHAKFLLENHKRLKLVQLFRDPRAIISSRRQTGWYYGKNYTINNDTNVLCKRIENDLASAQELKTLFPDRVKIIQYEDFYDPKRTTEALYQFLNMNMTDYVKKSILAPLIANSPKNRNKRAGFHPDSYRDKLDSKVVLATNKHCKKVFDSLGLRAFNNANEVKNRNLSVIVDKLQYSLD